MTAWIIFVLGALFGYTISRAYTVLKGASLDMKMFRIAELYCLQMLTTCLEDRVFIKEVKYRVMRSNPEFGENQAKISKNEDEYSLSLWKDNVIKHMISVYPPHYKGIIKYNDWKGAMAWLNYFTQKKVDNDSIIRYN